MLSLLQNDYFAVGVTGKAEQSSITDCPVHCNCCMTNPKRIQKYSHMINNQIKLIKFPFIQFHTPQ